MLRERIDQVEERIQQACGRAGRRREEITLVAVTKKFSPQVMLDAYDCGLRVFGENYVQEFERKRPELGAMREAQVHFIGHLQSNKTRVAAEIFEVIETVDAEKIARRLDQAAGEIGRTLGVMLEVKLSDEESKAGAGPSEIPALIEAVLSCPNLRLDGLMTMPPWNDDQEQTRPYFKKLAAIAREHGLAKLSMGMSHDFEAAIEEGATHIRVGTALFGPRPKPTSAN
ncbi:MAG: YggS family pyridoxal phosphate-dependent enzyme [Bryobacteraceae bacterium]